MQSSPSSHSGVVVNAHMYPNIDEQIDMQNKVLEATESSPMPTLFTPRLVMLSSPQLTPYGAQPPVVPIDVEDETQPPIPLAPTGDGPYPSINLSSERIPNPTSHARAIQVTPLPRYSQQRIFMKGSAYEMERVEHHSRRAPAYWKRVKNEGKQKFHDCALTLEVAQENYFKDDGKRQDVARCTRFIDCYTSFFERQNIKYNDPRGNEGCSMFMFGRFAWRIPRLAIPNDFKGLVLSGNIKCLPTVSIIRTHIPRGHPNLPPIFSLLSLLFPTTNPPILSLIFHFL
eukprot:86625-Amorphochlora_amoeboformis.AAC.1